MEPEESFAKSPEPAEEELAKSPEATEQLVKSPEATEELVKSPEATEELVKSPELAEELAKSPEPSVGFAKSPEPLQDLAKSPAFAASPIPSEDFAKSPIPPEISEPKPSSDLLNLEEDRPESISPQSSPLPRESSGPNENLCQIPQNFLPDSTQEIIPESPVIKTPEPEFDDRSSGIQSPEPEALINVSSPEPSLNKEEILENLASPSPVEEVTSSVKDEVASPEPKEVLEVESEKVTESVLFGNEPTLQASGFNLGGASDVNLRVNDVNLEKSGINFSEEISNAIQETLSAVEEVVPKAESTPKSDVSR